MTGILAVVLFNFQVLWYGINQATGQLKIIWNTKPVTEMLKDPNVADSVKYKLQLIQDIKKFAVDSLGINKSDNYTTFYDQKGKPILWVVTACPPYEMKAKEWKFPIIGSFSYKGFFKYQYALEEELEMKKQGYETAINTASGWSTLGWFKDPILSNMLRRNEGRLANLIIHELTHGTLYVKNQVEFNENLASFIGDKGAEAFLNIKYGKNSEEYKEYENYKSDDKKFSDHILNGAKLLDSLYKTFSNLTPDSIKADRKKKLIEKIVVTMDTIKFYDTAYFHDYFEGFIPNNTFFMSFLRYESKLDEFEKEYQEKFQGDLRKYLIYLKKKYPSL